MRLLILSFLLLLISSSGIYASESSSVIEDSCHVDSLPGECAPESLIPTPSPSTLTRIITRGRLICAHCDDTLGHSLIISNTSASGMEPELCAGLAASLGVEASYYRMRTPSERFPLLQSGTIDIAFALTSKTIQRDMKEKGSFSLPYFQDQHNLMFRSDAALEKGEDLKGKTICVTEGTTNPNVLNDYIATLGLSGKVKVLGFASDDAALKQLYDGVCHGFVNDDSVVAGYVHTLTPPSGVTYHLASWSGTPFARAPFSALTLDGDAEFASLIDWYVNGLFLAEMYGVASENVEEMVESRTIPGEAQRLLDVNFLSALVSHGKPVRFSAAIKKIGNYAQLYERNFGAFLSRSRANKLYRDGGAIFPGGWR